MVICENKRVCPWKTIIFGYGMECQIDNVAGILKDNS